MMTVDGPAGQTLEDWKKIWKDGFVAEEVLAYNEASYIDAYRSGRYVFSPQQIYDLKTFNDPTKSAAVAGKTGFLPYQGQPWGLIDSAVYLMTSRQRPEAMTDDVKRFASWYGYKDEKGEMLRRQSLDEGEHAVLRLQGGHGERRGARDHQRLDLNPADYDKLIEVYSHTPYPEGHLERGLGGGVQYVDEGEAVRLLPAGPGGRRRVDATNERSPAQQEVQDQVSLKRHDATRPGRLATGPDPGGVAGLAGRRRPAGVTSGLRGGVVSDEHDSRSARRAGAAPI